MEMILPTKKFGDVKFFIDEEDDFLATREKLYVIKNNNHLYIVNSDRKYLHRLIMGAEKGQVVDHINHNTLDNRKYNLRPCTHQENCRNKNMRTDNKSGVIGVYFSKEHNKWRAQIKINGKNVMVYYGSSKEDAIKARLEAEAKYYREFAPQRHLFEQYGIINEVNLNE